jgi:hypothetical protein
MNPAMEKYYLTFIRKLSKIYYISMVIFSHTAGIAGTGSYLNIGRFW